VLSDTGSDQGRGYETADDLHLRLDAVTGQIPDAPEETVVLPEPVQRKDTRVHFGRWVNSRYNHCKFRLRLLQLEAASSANINFRFQLCSNITEQNRAAKSHASTTPTCLTSKTEKTSSTSRTTSSLSWSNSGTPS
jgi:hypothetical protein